MSTDLTRETDKIYMLYRIILQSTDNEIKLLVFVSPCIMHPNEFSVIYYVGTRPILGLCV